MSRHQARPRPIHLLEFGLRWPPDTFIAAKLEQLVARGLRITVACPDSRRVPTAGIPGVRLESVVPAGRTTPFALLAAVARLTATRPGRVLAVARAARAPSGDGRPVGRREALGRLRTYARLASLQPDVVQFEWNTTAVHFHSLVEALGCPSVVSVRGGDLEIYPHAPSTRRLAAGYPAAFRQAAAVHCVSEAAVDQALAHGLRPAKARVIRPAVDPFRFRPRAEPAGSDNVLRVVSIGWLHWRKGWEYALQSIARLVAEGVPVTFDVVGGDSPSEQTSSSDGDRVRAVIGDLGLASHVTIHGSLGHDDVRRLLEQADALLHTSLAEGIPNVVLEAMACGIGVVATDVGGTREVITDGVEGFLIPPRDPGAAVDALRTLWQEPNLRRAMGQAARARVEAELTLERQTDRWVELYQDVLAPSSATRRLRLVEVGLGWPPETTFLLRKLQGLAERGMDVAVASTVTPGTRPPWVAGITLEPLPHWAESSARAALGLAKDGIGLLLFDRRRLRALRASRRAMPADVARDKRRLALLRLHLRLARLRTDIAHFEWASFAVTCWPLPLVWDAATVISCHGSEVLVDPPAGRAVDLAGLFEQVSAVHCVAEAVERAAIQRGLDASRARLIPSAVDTNVFRPPRREPPRDGVFAVAAVADLRWVKGFEYALGAIARLAESGVPIQYEIAGAEPTYEPGELRRILTAVADLRLQDRVRLHGRLAERDVVSLLQRVDAFLQTSLAEGMPTAVLEAMACGVPVVATDVGGTREVLTDGVEGFLIPPRDPAAAADALRILFDDSERRRVMGRAGRARIRDGLTLERQLDSFELLYAELAAS